MDNNRVLLADLGWCIARLSLCNGGLLESLKIISPSDTSEDRYAPAESVAIYGREHIVALNEFLSANLHAIENNAKEPL